MLQNQVQLHLNERHDKFSAPGADRTTETNVEGKIQCGTNGFRDVRGRDHKTRRVAQADSRYKI